MKPVWQTKSGRLIIGGCGTQVGLLFTVGSIGLLLGICVVCAFSNIVSLGVLQQTALEPTPTPLPTAQASVPPEELILLRQKMDLLVERVQTLRTTGLPAPAPTPVPPPTPLPPLVIAHKTAAILRAGPELNYPQLGRLPAGQTLEIVGRNADSSWWLVASPEGQFAWVSNMAVRALYVTNEVPMVTIPALLALAPASGSNNPQPAAPAAIGAGSAPAPALAPPADPAPALPQPAGTPTAAPQQNRQFVQDTRGYKQLIRRLLLPTVSESFSPHGEQVAITERIKLYTIPPGGENSRVLVEDNNDINLLGGAVWSPDGAYIAFIIDFLHDCQVCRGVGLVRLSDGQITFLEPPTFGLGLDLPRWTQDGRLVVTVHSGRAIEGSPHIYTIDGQNQEASGSYLLSASHDGQKWFPWQPGRVWPVESGAPPDSYYRD